MLIHEEYMRTFSDFLRNDNIGSEVLDELENESVLAVGVSFEQAPSNRALMFFRDHSCSINIFGIANSLNPAKKEEFLKICNRITIEKRFARFSLNENNGIDGEVEIFYNDDKEKTHEQLHFCLVILIRAINEYYQSIMKIQWS